MIFGWTISARDVIPSKFLDVALLMSGLSEPMEQLICVILSSRRCIGTIGLFTIGVDAPTTGTFNTKVVWLETVVVVGWFSTALLSTAPMTSGSLFLNTVDHRLSHLAHRMRNAWAIVGLVTRTQISLGHRFTTIGAVFNGPINNFPLELLPLPGSMFDAPANLRFPCSTEVPPPHRWYRIQSPTGTAAVPGLSSDRQGDSRIAFSHCNRMLAM
ncbi:hypothetical protein C8R43DRAFT_955633 [Mycena crocata]|nr:hypothetical protein C8R43DRAFT_955633 [Mycena crocata]